MKISNIKIQGYHQFRNVSLDLTYPEGHEKAGKPLDKVCIIGQSGTGKTSLLNICRAIIHNSYVFPDMTGITATSHLSGLRRITKIKKAKFTYDYPDRNTVYSRHLGNGKGHISIKPGDYTNEEDLFRDFYQDSTIVVYFPATLANYSEYVIGKEKTKNIGELIGIKNNKKEPSKDKSLQNKFFDFTHDNVFDLWNNTIMKNIKDYRNKELQFNQRVTKALEQGIEEAETALQEFKEWKQNTPNPIVPYAQKLNRILNEFCLEVNTEFTYESEEDITFIEIKHKAGTEIPFNGWSTGTLQIVFTATPLLQLNTENSIILVDEPETSLFPDIQEKIIKFYTELAPQAQFFFATHSPIIASCFEPWEIVELKFDETGYVVQESYFDEAKGKHINNYSIDPRYLRWDSILQRLFDLDEDGNREYRIPKLMELATIKSKLKKLKQQGKTSKDELAELWQQYERIAELVGWKIDETDR